MPSHSPAAYLCYDPRDPSQCPDDSRTWKPSRNGILVLATMLHRSRENDPIDWDRVAILADMGEEADMIEPARAFVTIADTNRMLHTALAGRETDFA
jgi:hypothetical protein